MKTTRRADIEHVRHRASIVGRVLIGAACLMFAAFGLLLGRILFVEDDWSPLGPYPTQRVIEPRDATDTPVVSLADPVVHVEGRKCVEGDGYRVHGTVAWQSIDPRGTTIRTGEGTRDATDGCQDFEFRNDIPNEVWSIMARQVADGLSPVWQIVGTEEPIDGRRVGTPLSWETEPFRVEP